MPWGNSIQLKPFSIAKQCQAYPLFLIYNTPLKRSSKSLPNFYFSFRREDGQMPQPSTTAYSRGLPLTQEAMFHKLLHTRGLYVTNSRSNRSEISLILHHSVTNSATQKHPQQVLRFMEMIIAVTFNQASRR